MNMPKSRLLALAAAHSASLLAVPAVLAAEPTAGQIEEIVDTARQREEKIEDVPVTISAFTQADIRSAGIERPTDFIALTPGVMTAATGDSAFTAMPSGCNSAARPVDSRSSAAPRIDDAGSVRFADDVVRRDPRFTGVDEQDSLPVVERNR